MPISKLEAEIKISNVDEAIEKLNQVKQLMIEINELLGSIKIEFIKNDKDKGMQTY